VGSQSISTAHACTTFPLGCLSGVSGTKSPSATKPVSSVNSRLAAASGSSPGSNSPLGIDQAPSSFLAQKGPPGCTRKTSRTPAFLRYNSSPADRKSTRLNSSHDQISYAVFCLKKKK